MMQIMPDHLGAAHERLRLLLVGVLLCLCAVAPRAGAAGELPVFSGADFDRLIMTGPLSGVPSMASDLDSNRVKPITRYAGATPVRRAAQAVGQLRVQVVDDEGGTMTVACTAFLVADSHILTSARCVTDLFDDPGVAARRPRRIARMDFITGYDAPEYEAQGERHNVDPAPVGGATPGGAVLLHVDGRPGADRFVPELSEDPVAPGTELQIIGHPLGGSMRVLRRDCAAQATDADGQLRHDCPDYPGLAGAPVLTHSGQVVALHLDGTRSGQRNSALPVAEILASSEALRRLLAGDACPAGGCAEAPGAAAEAPAQPVPEPPQDTPEQEADARPPAPASDPPTQAAQSDAAEASSPPLDLPEGIDIFPVGIGAEGPPVYGARLPYLRPGTSMELAAGPVGAILAPSARIFAAPGDSSFALTLAEIGGERTVVSVWDLHDGTLKARRLLPEAVEHAAISPDGGLLVLSLRDRTGRAARLELWEVPAMTPLREFDGPARVAFTPQGDRLVTAGSEVVIRDLPGGAVVRRIPGTGGPADALGVSPDGQTLGVADLGGVTLFDFPTGTRLRRFDRDGPEPVQDLRFSPDGVRLVTGAGEIWQSGGEGPSDRLDLPRGARVLGLTPDGEMAVVLDTDAGQVSLRRLSDGSSVRTLPIDHVAGAALGAQGTRLIAHVAGSVPALVFLDLETDSVPRVLPAPRRAVRSLAFAPDSTRLAVGGAGFPAGQDGGDRYGQLTVWSWEDGQVTFSDRGFGTDGPSVLDWHPDGSAFVAQGGDSGVRIHDFANDAQQQPDQGVPDAGDLSDLRVGPDGAFLAGARADGPVVLWDAQTGDARHRIEGASPALSPDGKTLALVASDARGTPEVVLYDTAAGARLRGLDTPFAEVGPLAYRGPEDEIIGAVRARSDGPWSFALWQATDGTLLDRFGAFEGALADMAVSPDGRVVAIAVAGQPDVRLWDIPRGMDLWRLDTGGAPVGPLAFAPDGLRLAAGLSPGVVALWDMINAQSKARLLSYPDGTLAQVGTLIFLSDPALIDRAAVRLPDGSYVPVATVLKDGLPTLIGDDKPMTEQVSGILDRLRDGDAEARRLLIEDSALYFDIEFRYELQKQLKAGEFYAGAIDGDIGPASRKALERFAAAEDPGD